jgi:hypothetical protein
MKHWHPAPADVRAGFLDFTPVPRKKRAGGWTAERQRQFIAALAECGSVRSAARQVGMTAEGAYTLRLAPNSESFCAAWQAAQESGLRGLHDIAMERARDGVAVPVYYRGEQVGEKRWYNDRLLMFLMKHNAPPGSDPRPLPGGTKHPRTLAREAAQAEAAAEPSPEDAHAKALEEIAIFLDQVLDRYQKKVLEERTHRLAGHVVAADFALRQLTHIELILDIGGRSQQLIKEATEIESRYAGGGPVVLNASPISELIAERRQAVWDKLADPPRPPLDLEPQFPSHAEPRNGETRKDRDAARRDAVIKMAAAQAVWEAAATEETWAAFTASGER